MQAVRCIAAAGIGSATRGSGGLAYGCRVKGAAGAVGTLGRSTSAALRSSPGSLAILSAIRRADTHIRHIRVAPTVL